MIALLQAGRGPVGVMDMILRGNVSTQVILAVTALFSLISWIIIIWKLAQLRRVRRQGQRFLAAVERTQRLEDVYKSLVRLPESPYTAVFRQGMNFFSELRPGALRENAPASAGLSEAQLQALRLMMEKEQDAQVESVLKELEAEKKPRLHVMNKLDLLPSKQRESLRDDEETLQQRAERLAQSVQAASAGGPECASQLFRACTGREE